MEEKKKNKLVSYLIYVAIVLITILPGSLVVVLPCFGPAFLAIFVFYAVKVFTQIFKNIKNIYFNAAIMACIIAFCSTLTAYFLWIPISGAMQFNHISSKFESSFSLAINIIFDIIFNIILSEIAAFVSVAVSRNAMKQP